MITKPITTLAISLMLGLTCCASMASNPPKNTNPVNDEITGPSPGRTYGPTGGPGTGRLIHRKYRTTTTTHYVHGRRYVHSTSKTTVIRTTRRHAQ